MHIALFVASLLVFLCLLLSQVLTLFFSLFAVTVLGLSVRLATSISLDGENNWLAGATLLVLWRIAGLGFFFID
jgi:Ca2+:H+ antiporter